MIVTILGLVADELGFIHTRSIESNRVHHQYGSFGSWEYRTCQPQRISVDVDHEGPPIGVVRHLERDDSGIWAVCELDHPEQLPGDHCYFSPFIEHIDGTEIELRALSLCAHPATVGAKPFNMLPGDIKAVSRRPIPNTFHKGLLERARTSTVGTRVIAERRSLISDTAPSRDPLRRLGLETRNTIVGLQEYEGTWWRDGEPCYDVAR